MRLLDRYLNGQHVQVWTELLGIGPGIREDAEDWAEARAVAAEAMARVRRNVQRLQDGLPALGYRFAEPTKVHVDATNPADQIARVEEVVGPLPLAVVAFWEIVGAVDFSGQHLEWPHRLLDPLMVEFDADYIIDTYKDRVDQGDHQPGQPFMVDFAPDDLHKGDISGGPPYAIAAPNPSVDGLVLWEIHQTTFVNYLRIVIGHAGMGGLSRVKRHGHEALPLPADVADLVATLESF